MGERRAPRAPAGRADLLVQRLDAVDAPPLNKAIAALGTLIIVAGELGRLDLVDLVASFTSYCENTGGKPGREELRRFGVVLDLQAVQASGELRAILQECRRRVLAAVQSAP